MRTPSLVSLNERVSRPKLPARGALWHLAVVAVLAALSAVALRAVNVSGAYELFVDEILYTDLGRSFAAGDGPRLFDAPFFLHPPLFFLLVGAVVRAPFDPLTVDAVLALRPINVVLGGVNAALVVLVSHRVVGLRLALAAGALYALDPFVVLFDSRLMLETSTMTGILAGLAALTYAAGRQGRGRRALVVGGGAAFGLALLTKETSALVTSAPLLLMAIVHRGLPRRDLGLVLLVQWAMFALYVLWVWLAGFFPVWWVDHSSGVRRAVGAEQTTGWASSPTRRSRTGSSGGGWRVSG